MLHNYIHTHINTHTNTHSQFITMYIHTRYITRNASTSCCCCYYFLYYKIRCARSHTHTDKRFVSIASCSLTYSSCSTKWLAQTHTHQLIQHYWQTNCQMSFYAIRNRKQFENMLSPIADHHDTNINNPQ